MRNDKVTSKQVAAMAGVSQSAVSRYFSPNTSVSKKTARKIQSAADALGYRPNILARSLKSGRSRVIGLVVAYLENYFYPDVVERLSNALQNEGYHVLVFISSNAADNVDRVLNEIMDYQVDGIIMASVSMSSSLAERCQGLGIPVVLFNRIQDDEHMSAVSTDNLAGGRKLADLLVSLGHRRIAYVAGFEGASTQRDREQGFRDGLDAAGLELFARGAGNFNYDEAQAAARLMFATSERPDAVFVCNDHMAFAVMDVLRFEFGLAVPEDVSVVGFDDVPPASWPAYNLTTYRQRVGAMVEQAVNIVTAGKVNLQNPQRVIIDGALMIRGSTRKHHTGS